MAWIFILYLATLLAIGTLSERTTKGMKGFLLGDRRAGPWATALSYEATAYSGWLLLGYPGRAFARGLIAIWVGVACVVGDALNWVTVARRLREQTSALGALTVPEYLERRFARPGSSAVRMTASLAILIFMLIYLWSQFVAAGKTLSTCFSMDYGLAAIVSGAVIVIYTLQGGYRAVVWTDCVQATMVIVALVLLPAACLYQMGSWGALSSALKAASSEAATMPRLAASSSHLTEWFAGLSGLALFSYLSEDVGIGLGYLGQPHTCVRFMAIDDRRQLRSACVVSILWACLVLAGAMAVGLAAHGRFRLSPEPASSGDTRVYLADPEQALPRLAMAILPEWLAGFAVSAIMAAIMSSSAGFLLSATSSLGQDVYRQYLRREPADRELLLVTRLSTGALGLLALGLALGTDPDNRQSAVYSLVLYAWGGLSGCFTAPVVMALYYKNMTRSGCLAGMVVGAATILAWHNIPALAGVVYELIPAVLLSATSIFLVSRFTMSEEATPSAERHPFLPVEGEPGTARVPCR